MNDKVKRILKFVLCVAFILAMSYFWKVTNIEEDIEIDDNNDIEYVEENNDVEYVEYYFRNEDLLNQHYEKHGIEMGFASAEEYQKAASDVVNNPDALYKQEKEDNDDVYFVEETGEFVIVSTDGYIRTYFIPDSGKKYFDKQ